MPSDYQTIRSVIRSDALILRVLDRRLVEPDHIARLGKELDIAVRDSAQKKVVLDFAAVEFLSSSMLTVLISLTAVAQASEQSLCLASLSDDLRKMFKMIKLDTKIKVFEDCDAAIKGR